MNLPPDHPALPPDHPLLGGYVPCGNRQAWLHRATGPSETGNQYAVPCPTPDCRATFKDLWEDLDEHLEHGDPLECHRCGETSVVTRIDHTAIIEVTRA